MNLLIVLTAMMAFLPKSHGLDMHVGAYVCHFTNANYTDDEISAVKLYMDCQNKRIEEIKADSSLNGRCTPPQAQANLKVQGRYNRARLCADQDYSFQKDCLSESATDADFKLMIEDCKKLRAAEKIAAQETMRKRTENDRLCRESFAKGFSLANKQPCRSKTMLPPPPSAPPPPQR